MKVRVLGGAEKGGDLQLKCRPAWAGGVGDHEADSHCHPNNRTIHLDRKNMELITNHDLRAATTVLRSKLKDPRVLNLS
jgi:hypothetical protein